MRLVIDGGIELQEREVEPRTRHPKALYISYANHSGIASFLEVIVSVVRRST